MAWKLYYEDGTVWCSENGPPESSPPYGTVMIVQGREQGEQGPWLLHIGDFFCYRTDDERWYQYDRDGLIDQLAHYAHLIGTVRPGRYVSDARFKELRATASKDVADWQEHGCGCG